MKAVVSFFGAINLIFFLFFCLALLNMGHLIGFLGTTIGIAILIFPIFVGLLFSIISLLQKNNGEKQSIFFKTLRLAPLVNVIIIILFIVFQIYG